MNENRLGPRAFFAALAIVASTFLGLAAMAQADDAPSTLYHVLESTFGCGDPSATRTLTDPGETRRSNSSWLRSTIASGRCVTITPRSPWKLVSQDNGVALMEYAGTVGAPGSYYIAINELVDAVGKHPGEGTLPPVPGQSQTNAQGAPSPANGAASETALAPNFPDNGATAQSAMPHGNWSTLDVVLLLVAISIAGVVGYVVGRNTRD